MGTVEAKPSLWEASRWGGGGRAQVWGCGRRRSGKAGKLQAERSPRETRRHLKINSCSKPGTTNPRYWKSRRGHLVGREVCVKGAPGALEMRSSMLWGLVTRMSPFCDNSRRRPLRIPALYCMLIRT